MKKRICFAGFPQEELTPLKQSMSRISSTWEGVFVPDGEAALAALRQGDIHAVVANMDAEGMDGAELLQKTGEINAGVLRFVVSDAANQEHIINCIGGTHQFIARPFNANALIATLQRSFALDAWLSTDQLRALVLRLRRLPSLPSTYFEVLKQVESPHSNMNDIGRVIARDPAATVRLLQMVNSAALALSEKITDPVQAVGLLGVETVKSLTLCLQVFTQTDELRQAGISPEQLWNHSLAVAKAASKLTFIQTRDAEMANEAFTAGLLHDVGRIVLATNIPKEYGQVVEAARKNSKPLYEEELAAFGVTHAQVGGYLLGVWGMPAALVEAATLHHEPSRSSWGDFSILTATHFANVYVHEKEGTQDGLPLPQIDMAHLQAVGLENKIDDWRDALSTDGIPSGDTERTARVKKTLSQPASRPVVQALPGTQPATAPLVSTGFRKWWFPFTAAAALVLIGIYWFGFGEPSAPVQVKARTRDQTPIAPAVVPAAIESNIVTQPADTTPAPAEAASSVPPAGNDTPQAPASKPATATSGFESVRLQGVFYSGANSFAIINGKTLRVGDRINGMVIVAIEKGKATLAKGTEQRVFQVK